MDSNKESAVGSSSPHSESPHGSPRSPRDSARSPRGSPRSARSGPISAVCSTPAAHPLNKFETLGNLSELSATPPNEWDSWHGDEDEDGTWSPDPFSKSFTFGANKLAQSQRIQLNAIRGFNMDLNATFPAPGPTKMRVSSGRGLHKLQGKGMNTLSFTPVAAEGSRLSLSSSFVNKQNWGLQSLKHAKSRAPAAIGHGPKKALVTIDNNHTVRVANQRACELFGYESAELTGLSLTALLPPPVYAPEKVVSDMLLNAEGQIQRVNGRVVEAKHRDGSEFPVSLWMAPAEDNDELRFMAVMEPVARITAVFGITKDTRIAWCEKTLIDLTALALDEVEGQPLKSLIPSMKLSKPENANAPIHVTVRSHGAAVPATLRLEPMSPDLRKALEAKGMDATRLDATVDFGVLHVYRNISGLVTCDATGTIVGCNENFVLLLFGFAERELLGKPVTTILPDFDMIGGRRESGGGGDLGSLGESLRGEISSTGLHADGSMIELSFEVKRVLDSKLKPNFCIWISKEETPEIDDDDDERAIEANESLSGAGLTVEDVTVGEFGERFSVSDTLGIGTFGTVFVAQNKETNKDVVVKFIQASKVLSECWEPPPEDADWVERLPLATTRDVGGHRAMPREVVLLMQLDHPNISRAIDVLASPTHYQLVFNYRGPTMDLFQYIDESAEFDEAVCGYIIHQVASAVDFLHGKQIIHRDIKDENVVIDDRLTAQVVDFGSAAYAVEGKLFDTFCGTLEYCAPEVLLGNPYAGPELDMFALGVTMYALIFGERPFYDVEETIAGVLCPPFAVGRDCEDLLLWILDADPIERATATDVLGHKWAQQRPILPATRGLNHLPKSPLVQDPKSVRRNSEPL